MGKAGLPERPKCPEYPDMHDAQCGTLLSGLLVQQRQGVLGTRAHCATRSSVRNSVTPTGAIACSAQAAASASAHAGACADAPRRSERSTRAGRASHARRHVLPPARRWARCEAVHGTGSRAPAPCATLFCGMLYPKPHGVQRVPEPRSSNVQTLAGGHRRGALLGQEARLATSGKLSLSVPNVPTDSPRCLVRQPPL